MRMGFTFQQRWVQHNLSGGGGLITWVTVWGVTVDQVHIVTRSYTQCYIEHVKNCLLEGPGVLIEKKWI